MGLLKILGVIVLIGAAYGFLKEFGVTQVIKIIIDVPIVTLLSASAAGVVLSLFGVDFDLSFSILFWVFLPLWAWKGIKKIREEYR